jgi:hypothetical protein|tara:strand:- start:96 stop:656 length:561 start_codon:yes stop_codon:yes gene_type:complete
MTFDFDGVPEIVAKVATSSDNETVKEKWEELKTLVHLVHKDEVIRQRSKLDDWKNRMSSVNQEISKLQQSSWGVGIEKDDDYTFDVSYSSGITFGGGSYGTTSMVTEFDNDTQMELNFPMNEDEEYANAGLTDEQMKHIEENTLSTPLSEYEAIENLSYSKEHIKQMQDPRHNQWGIAGEPKKTDD